MQGTAFRRYHNSAIFPPLQRPARIQARGQTTCKEGAETSPIRAKSSRV